MTIKNRLKILIAEKEHRESRRLTYRLIAAESGISTSTLTAYMGQTVESYAASTLNALCAYLDCQPGDILTYLPDTEPAGIAND